MVFAANFFPNTKKPNINKNIFITATILAGDITPHTLASTIEIPLAPPVEKLFANSKKYTPTAIKTVPNVIIIYVFKVFIEIFTSFLKVSVKILNLIQNLKKAVQKANDFSNSLRVFRIISSTLQPYLSFPS